MSQSSAAPAIAHNKPPEILSLIGDTPLVETTQFDTGPCRLFLKLENQNPGGSIKDRIARSDVTRGHPEYYQDVAARLAEQIAGGFYVNQFGNPANPLAHERTTGPEIWEQMRHDVDAVVVGVGSGGTLTGLGRFFNRVKPRRGIEMVLADPKGSILFEYIKSGKLLEAGSWAVEGIGEDFIPEIADMSL